MNEEHNPMRPAQGYAANSTARKRHRDSLMCQAESGDECAEPKHWTAEPDTGDVEALGEVIWTTSRADESTISTTGANVVARAILASDWLAAHDAQVRREHGERIAQALDGLAPSAPTTITPATAGRQATRSAFLTAARIARQEQGS